MNVIDYVREEVRRQGHDTSALDGIERVGWMLNAWSYALTLPPPDKYLPSPELAITLGKMVEPVKNQCGLRQCGVRVGTRICPDWRTLRKSLDVLFVNRQEHTPLEFYMEYELIHPFVDGNGRSGKIILNYLGGTLLSPIFPPNDFWGHWIRNP
jgi:hypothetical protein